MIYSDEEILIRVHATWPCPHQSRTGRADHEGRPIVEVCGHPARLLLDFTRQVGRFMGGQPMETWPAQYYCPAHGTFTVNVQQPLPARRRAVALVAEPSGTEPPRCVAHRAERPCQRCKDRSAARRAEAQARRLAAAPIEPMMEVVA